MVTGQRHWFTAHIYGAGPCRAFRPARSAPVAGRYKSRKRHKTNILLPISATLGTGIQLPDGGMNYFFVLEVINDEFCNCA
jgi:hypothetical protein